MQMSPSALYGNDRCALGGLPDTPHRSGRIGSDWMESGRVGSDWMGSGRVGWDRVRSDPVESGMAGSNEEHHPA